MYPIKMICRSVRLGGPVSVRILTAKPPRTQAGIVSVFPPMEPQWRLGRGWQTSQPVLIVIMVTSASINIIQIRRTRSYPINHFRRLVQQVGTVLVQILMVNSQMIRVDLMLVFPRMEPWWRLARLGMTEQPVM